MILVTNGTGDGRTAHLQDADTPMHPKAMDHRGFALCSKLIERQNYTWTVLPGDIKDPDAADAIYRVLKDQNWLLCIDCMLLALGHWRTM